jgi:membrane protein DedA with SNARE-associated domain
MPFELTPLLADVGESLLSDASYLWVIIFLILTGCGLPIPEEVGIIAAGVWAADGAVQFWPGLLACLFGCLVGDSIMYAIGYRFGKSVLRQHPMFTGFLTPERERHIEHLIRRRGAAVLFTARFLVGVRGPVYLTAGILHFPYRRFLLIDLLCATLVVSLFYSLAWYFGEGIITWIRTAEEGITIAVFSAIVLGAVLFWIHHRRSKRMLDTLDRISQGLPATEIAAVIEAATPHPSDSAEHVHSLDATTTDGNNDGNNSDGQTSEVVHSTKHDS